MGYSCNMKLKDIKNLKLENYNMDEFLIKYPRKGSMLIHFIKIGNTKKVAEKFGVGVPWVREVIRRVAVHLRYYHLT